ncbi:hypothetical protein [Spiroplasma ixodetis]|nr:hypothetical protein [Spiroplasma ixodetis]
MKQKQIQKTKDKNDQKSKKLSKQVIFKVKIIWIQKKMINTN